MISEEPLTCKLISEDESELLRDCILAVYGNTYPLPAFYDVDYIRNAIRDCRLHSLVAQNPQGTVVGNISTILEVEGDYTADGSAVMVAEKYRGKGAMSAMGSQLLELYDRLGLVGLHLYALTLHDVVQRKSIAGGAVVTGLFPAHFNRNATVSGFDRPECRIGSVFLYQPLRETPLRSVYLPSDYRDVLSGLYDRLSINRTLNCAPAPSGMPTSSFTSQIAGQDNGDRRLIVNRIGSDVLDVFADLHEPGAGGVCEVSYIDLPLNDPCIEHGVAMARKCGYFFGALVVERRGTDWLRMQYYAPENVSYSTMVIYSQHGEDVLRFIRQDQLR